VQLRVSKMDSSHELSPVDKIQFENAKITDEDLSNDHFKINLSKDF
jgi:hypothetical protein